MSGIEQDTLRWYDRVPAEYPQELLSKQARRSVGEKIFEMLEQGWSVESMEQWTWRDDDSKAIHELPLRIQSFFYSKAPSDFGIGIPMRWLYVEVSMYRSPPPPKWSDVFAAAEAILPDQVMAEITKFYMKPMPSFLSPYAVGLSSETLLMTPDPVLTNELAAMVEDGVPFSVAEEA